MKLNFGTYAKAIQPPTLNNEDFVRLLLTSVSLPHSVFLDGTNSGRYLNSQRNIPVDVRKNAVNYDTATHLAYFVTSVIPALDRTLVNQQIASLVSIIKSDPDISSTDKQNFLARARPNDFAQFLSAIFLYALQQENTTTESPTDVEVEDFAHTPFAHSINPKDFERVFTEVPHSETPTLANLKCVRTYHLDLSSNQIKFSDMQNFLYRNIGRYVFSRLELENFRINDELETVVAQALARIKDAGLSTTELADSLGDMILYAFLEFVLKAPKLYNKIELIETTGGSVVGQGGVHLLPLDANGSSFQLVVGKSNIVGNLQSAIDNAFKAIASASTTAAEKKEYKLLDSTILNKSFDPATAEYLKSIVLPQKRKAGITVDDAFGIFLGYSLNLDTNGLSNDEYRVAAKQKMADDIKNHLPYIQTAITNAKLEGRSFYFYLLPFNNADSDKGQIMQELLGVDNE